MFQAKMSRRGFLVGCSTAIAGMAGARLGHVALAQSPEAASGDVLVVVFLRGGWDVLSVLPPISGNDRKIYERARPQLKIPLKGKGAALPLNDQLGLNARLAPLMDLYRSGNMAIVQAAGLSHDTRSHFDAMEYIELGTPGDKGATSGWITRHLNSKPNAPAAILPAVGIGGNAPTSLLAHSRAVSVSSLEYMNLPSESESWQAQQAVLRDMYRGDAWVRRAGANALSAIDAIRGLKPAEYKPASGARYPENEFGNSLKSIALMLKSGLGVQAVSVDFGGWDTHESQSYEQEGHMPELLGTLGSGLAAFYADLAGAGLTKRLTVVTMSEFGRRLNENESRGTDHGHGSAMFVLGGNVNGGKLYGEWPGLANEQLFERTDLAVTTDFRRVLGEIVTRRLGNPNLEKVFPGYAGFAPMGIVR